jgi:hypothetical protein
MSLFHPFVNVLFFLALCFLPSKHNDTADEAASWPHVRPLDQLIPGGKLTSSVLSIAAPSLELCVFTSALG